MNDETGKEHQSKISMGLSARCAPASLKDPGKNEGVDDQHQHWVYEGPGNAAQRAPIASAHFSLHKLIDERTISSRTAEDFGQGGGVKDGSH